MSKSSPTLSDMVVAFITSAYVVVLWSHASDTFRGLIVGIILFGIMGLASRINNDGDTRK